MPPQTAVVVLHEDLHGVCGWGILELEGPGAVTCRSTVGVPKCFGVRIRVGNDQHEREQEASLQRCMEELVMIRVR